MTTLLHSTSESCFNPPPQTELQRRPRAPKSEIASIFLPDAEIGSSVLFRFLSAMTLVWTRLFHDLRVIGMENIPEGGVMLLGFHTTHNIDIFLGVFLVRVAPL